MGNIHYRNIKERQHGIPVRTAGTGVLSHTMWMKAVRPCTRSCRQVQPRKQLRVSLHSKGVFP